MDAGFGLRVWLTELRVERLLRVRGQLHVGGLMLRVVDELDIMMDWSDHALFWPSKNIWLHNTRFTLDEYSLTADALLHFTPMHKILRIQLPDLRFLECNVNCGINAFDACLALCRDLGIEHGEELSFSKPLSKSHLKSNYAESNRISRAPTKSDCGRSRVDTNNFISKRAKQFHSSATLHRSQPCLANFHSHPGTLRRGHISDGICDGMDPVLDLSRSPAVSQRERSDQLRPQSLREKARMNVGWLDSSLSIMEQGIRSLDTLLLRFKYYNFFDLGPKSECARVNLLYEQAKYQIINEHIECTEEEAMLFAALQLQVNIQTNLPQMEEQCDENLDTALNELQLELHQGQEQVTHLADYLRFFKPRRFCLKSYSRHFFVLRDLQLLGFSTGTEASSNDAEPIVRINLKGCEVAPDLNLAQKKFQIRLQVPSAENMTEIWIRCDTESQYCRWLTAFKLAAKGLSLADEDFESEVNSLHNFLSMQRPNHLPSINLTNHDVVVEELVPPKFLKRSKNKIRERILENHQNVRSQNLLQSKLSLIKAWQALPDFGISLFIVRFQNEKKEELLGITSNRLLRININSGEHIKSWRFSIIKAWNVNWESRMVMIELDDEKSIVFSCLSADCKVVHEFIGGYIYLSMRNRNQELNEHLFHKLTSGWV